MFGPLEVLAEIGRGGMGCVYAAWDDRTQRQIALKRLREEIVGDPSALRRFREEIALVSNLHHPHILPVYEAGTAADIPYYTMMLAEGGSLADRLSKLALDLPARVRILEKAARALQHAHEHGVLHLDLKPANILLTAEGEPMLADFGIAARVSPSGDLTRSQLMGTPHGVAPEVLRGNAAGRAADVFGFGAVLYEVFAGQAPFAAPSVAAILRNISTDNLVSPRRLRPEMPRELESICLRCLAHRVRDRYANAGDIAEDLCAWLDGRVVRAHRRGWIARTMRGARRFRTPLGIALLAGIAAGALLLLRWETGRRDGEIAAQQAQRDAWMAREDALRKAADFCTRREPAPREEVLSALASAWRRAPDANLLSAAIAVLAQAEFALVSGGISMPASEIQRRERQVVRAMTVARQLAPAVARCADLSADGSRLLVGGDDRKLHLWDVPRRRQLRTFDPAHGGAIHRVGISPDGLTAFSLADDGVLRMWDLETGGLLGMVRRDIDADGFAAWSANGDAVLVTSRASQKLIAWRVSRSRIVKSFLPYSREDFPEELSATVDVSPGGRWVIASGEKGIRIWDGFSRREAVLFPKLPEEWAFARIAPDGRGFWFGGWTSGVAWLDMPVSADGCLGKPRPLPQAAGGQLYAISAHGRWLALLEDNGDRGGVRLVQADGGRVLEFLHPRPSAAALSPDESRIATASYGDDGVRMWDVSTGRKLWEIRTGDTNAQPVWHPDGQSLFLRTDQAILRISAADGRELQRFASQGWIAQSLALVNDAAQLAIVVDNEVVLLDAESGRELARLPRPDRWTPLDEVKSLATDSTGMRLAVHYQGGCVQLWDFAEIDALLKRLGMPLGTP